MNNSGHKIMYVGLQMVPSTDRPNSRPDRVWHGPGDVVGGIPPLQAHALLQHPKEWADVTDLNEAQLRQAQQGARAASEAKVRELHNPPGAPNGQRNVDGLTDEELELELERRHKARRQIHAAQTQQTQQSLQQNQSAPAVTERPKIAAEVSEAIASAIERIMVRVQENADEAKTLCDEQGLPTQAAVHEALGFAITEDEYKAALGIDDRQA